MRPLHYQGDIGDALVNEHDMHRVLGPDTAKGYSLVTATTYDPVTNVTTAWCRPLALQDLLYGVKDETGQWWLPTAAVG